MDRRRRTAGREPDRAATDATPTLGPATTMIWPGRNLALALLVPAVMSLALLIPRAEAFGPALAALDGLIAAVALADLATLLGAGPFRAERRCGAVASLGEPHRVELAVENLGRRRHTLRIKDDVPGPFEAEPAEFLASLPPRGRAMLEYTVTPRRRGSYAWRRVDALLDSRLGFWRRHLRLPVETGVRVYPDVRQIARYGVLARRDRLTVLGVRRARRLGTENEFERLRDYQEGDEPRHIDWRATARRRVLTVRAHQADQSQRVVFLLDCGRMLAGDVGDGTSPLDHALNALLLLAHVALGRGDQVGLLAFADRPRAYLPPRGGPRQIDRLVNAVHDVFPAPVEPRYDRAFVELGRRLRKRSLVVLMTDLFDDVHAAILADHLALQVGRHLPLGVFLRERSLFALADAAAEDPAGPRLYRGAAAAALLSWRERALAGLRGRGVLTLDVFPDALTAPLVNRYLEIKARHLL